MRSKYILTLSIALVAIAVRFRIELLAGVLAAGMQLAMHFNNDLGMSLLLPGFARSPNTLLPSLDMGVANIYKMKLIYLLRYIAKDQFFLSSLSDAVLEDIKQRLEAQFARNGWTNETFSTIPVPTFTWSEATAASADDFFTRYVKEGIPVVIKKFPSEAVRKWSPEYFATIAGDHVIDIVNTSSISVVRMSIGDFVKSQSDANGRDVLYIRALSDIFDLHQHLKEEVGHSQFQEFMKGRLLTAQIFMGMKKAAGTAYHCANFNNLFFQIAGRKKWTFVAPDYNPLMYPMFNERAMDVASFLTPIAMRSDEMMNTHFPLYKFAPKMEIVLEPGDILFNPPYQWHMIENLDDISVAVASRWFLNMGQKYQNSVHSTMQFLSKYIWSNFYDKAFTLMRGGQAHKPSNTVPIDERFNFGKIGSAKDYRPKIFTPAIYEDL